VCERVSHRGSAKSGRGGEKVVVVVVVVVFDMVVEELDGVEVV
jgi:hypothetical protein